MAAYLNNGHFVIVLLDANDVGVQVVLQRIALTTDQAIVMGSARHPEDGATFEELLEAAKSRAAGAKAA